MDVQLGSLSGRNVRIGSQNETQVRIPLHQLYKFDNR
jgi:hypothetical protein